MEQPRRTDFTADEFIAWAEAQPTGRFELFNGEIVAMASERVNHARAKSSAWLALRLAIAARGLDCEALPDGMALQIDERSVYEPDVLVRCGPRLPGDAVKLDDAVIVVEIISPSSRNVDTGLKFTGYFRLPGLRHYLIVDTVNRNLLHHRRDERGEITSRVLRAGPLALDPPGVEIDVGEIFAGL